MLTKTDEQLYIFVDKSGHCFEDFRCMGANNGALAYNNILGSWLARGKKFSVGDMLAFRDDLFNAGFKWGVDFYARKV